MPAVPMKKIDLRWLGECLPKHRRYSLMFAEHLVTIADCSLRWLVIYRRYFCGGGGGGGGGWREGRRGGVVDLYKFVSWFMSVIFLCYFTCMLL